MGRPRKWKSDAERKRAERGGLSVSEYEEPGPSTPNDSEAPLSADLKDSPATVEWDGKARPVVRVHPNLSEQAYVDQEVLATKLQIKAGLHDHDGKREDRARKYARWRYRGWQVGEIASL